MGQARLCHVQLFVFPYDFITVTIDLRLPPLEGVNQNMSDGWYRCRPQCNEEMTTFNPVECPQSTKA